MTDNLLESVVVIDTVTNTGIATISGVGFNPQGLAITPDGAHAYVAGFNTADFVFVIDTSTNIVTNTVTVGTNPVGVAITPTTGIGPPTNKDQCKNGGWKSITIPRKFKNQGDCVSFVDTGK